MSKNHNKAIEQQPEQDFTAWLDSLVNSPSPAPLLIETGTVTDVADGVAIVSGLARALSDELLVFASGVQGIVLDLEPGRLGVILLGQSEQVRLGEAVYRTRKVVSVPVGSALLGRVVDAMGRPRDKLGPIDAVAEHPIEAQAPSVLNRTQIYRPLATGIKAIDAAIPVGLGQRELII